MLRVGIVGCGKIADGHVEQIRATGRAEVVGVCDARILMAEQLGERLGVAARYADFVRMLDEQRPDVVHIATPPSSHVDLAVTAMRAGAHVFVEKPFALNAAATDEIVRCAETHGRRVGVNYLYSFESVMLEARRLVDSGAIGDVVHVDAAYGYNLAGDYGIAVLRDPTHWVHRLPGKLFHNVLDHVVSKIVPFIDDVADVGVISLRRRRAIGDPIVDGLDDELRFMIRSGCVTAIGVVSAHARPVAHTLRIVGTRDTLELDLNARTLVRAAQQRHPSAIGRLIPAMSQSRQFARSARRNLTEFRRADFHYFQGMRVLLGRFYAAIMEGGVDPVPLAEIGRASRLIDLIVAASERRGAVA